MWVLHSFLPARNDRSLWKQTFFADPCPKVAATCSSQRVISGGDRIHKDNHVLATLDVQADAHARFSHTIYKIKVDESYSLTLKARKAPHDSKHSLKEILKSDYCT